jgi:hypothetical protein
MGSRYGAARGAVPTSLYLNPLAASCALSASATTESKLFRTPNFARSFLMNSSRSFDNCMISARICRRWAWRFSISCFRSAGERLRSSSGSSSGFGTAHALNGDGRPPCADSKTVWQTGRFDPPSRRAFRSFRASQRDVNAPYEQSKVKCQVNLTGRQKQKIERAGAAISGDTA